MPIHRAGVGSSVSATEIEADVRKLEFIDSGSGNTAETGTFQDIGTISISAGDLANDDILIVELEGHNTDNTTYRAYCYLDVDDGTNNATVIFGTSTTGLDDEAWKVEARIGTSPAVANNAGLLAGASGSRVDGNEKGGGCTASMINNFMTQDLTITIKGRANGGGTAYYKWKAYRLVGS